MATPSLLRREAGTSTPKQRPARRRLSPSHLLIGVVAVLAFSFNYLALQEREATTEVAVAAGPITSGAPFSSDLVRMVPVGAGFEGIEHLVTESDLGGYEGWTVVRPLGAGEPLRRSDLVRSGAGDGQRTMSIPVAVEHAAGGTLVVGDRVDVIAVTDEGAEFVAGGLEVVAVADREGGGLAGVTPYHVVVAVDPEQALALASAIAEGSFEVVRSTGAGSLGES